MNSLKEKDRQNALNEVRILASYDDPYIIGYKVNFRENNRKHFLMKTPKSYVLLWNLRAMEIYNR